MTNAQLKMKRQVELILPGFVATGLGNGDWDAEFPCMMDDFRCFMLIFRVENRKTSIGKMCLFYTENC